MKTESHARIICKVTKIGAIQEIKKNGGKTILKKPITVQFEDGRTMYPELRNRFVHIFEDKGIEENEDVVLDIRFEGSEKKGIRYNNINIIKAVKLTELLESKVPNNNIYINHDKV